jgi:hypothetical protein
MKIKATFHKIISVGLIAWLSVTLVTFSQTNNTPPTVEKDTDKGKARKATGTVLTPNSKPIPIPSYNVEIMATDGRKITATVMGYPGEGVQIITADQKQHVIKWETLSWETVAKLTGQELSYDKVGMDAQWLPAGPPRCSRSR